MQTVVYRANKKTRSCRIAQETILNILSVCLVAQSCPTLCDPMDCIAHQAPLSMRFSRQEYWSGKLLPSTGDLPDPGIEPGSPALQADSLSPEPPGCNDP